MCLDLTLARMRQIVAAIELRVEQWNTIERLTTEWSAKILGGVIVATSMLDKEGRTKVMQSLLEQTLTKKTTGAAASSPATPIQKEPEAGSYEKFQLLMGRSIHAAKEVGTDG